MLGNVIIRANESGVWFGNLVDHSPDFSWVKLEDALHLWQWQTIEGVTCAALAKNGINIEKSRVSPAVTVVVIGACEVIKVTDEAALTFTES